jgi:transcriptional regulator with XRE-family HTH domain
MKKIDFGIWLEGELEKRNMKPADLARSAGLDQGVISNLINNKRNAGVDSCKAIARSFKIPVTEVLRAAGIIDPEPDNDPIIDNITNLLMDLDTEDKRDVLEYAKLRHNLAEQKPHNARNSKRVPRRPAAT